VLIILPPSETKRSPPAEAPTVDLDALSFPALNPMRQRVLGALVETSLQPDAQRRLFVGPSLANEVARNVYLVDVPTRPATETYAGPLYQGLDAAAWSPHAAARAASEVVIVSALWGALRPADRIPAYRLHVCSRLVGIDRLEPGWRPLLVAILAEAAGHAGPILDLRSRAYQAVGRPAGLDEQTVTLRIRPAPGGLPHVGDVIAKRMRGEAASHLLASGANPDEPLDIADVLSTRWSLEIDQPGVRDRTWVISLQSAR
jgi:cytoplasmic iron level regulating protein YaaA (DUF328/UPF0246 family)